MIGMTYYRDAIEFPAETTVAGRELWKQSGRRASDTSVTILSDYFAPTLVTQLKALVFCKPGQGVELVRSRAINRDGRLPVNTHGGQIEEGYPHGFNGISSLPSPARVRVISGCCNRRLRRVSPLPSKYRRKSRGARDRRSCRSVSSKLRGKMACTSASPIE